MNLAQPQIPRVMGHWLLVRCVYWPICLSSSTKCFCLSNNHQFGQPTIARFIRSWDQ
jgi:hypothetical protein